MKHNKSVEDLLKNTIIHVSKEEDSELVQHFLFDNGCKWQYGGTTFLDAVLGNNYYLIIDDDLIITFTNDITDELNSNKYIEDVNKLLLIAKWYEL